MDITRVKKVLNYKPSKNNAELLLEAYNYYIKNKKISKFGSGMKPKMGFFNVIKFFQSLFKNIFELMSKNKIISFFLFLIITFTASFLGSYITRNFKEPWYSELYSSKL